MKNRTSDLRIPRSDALPLSHIDSTVSEVYYEVHMMIHVLHTARISNVDSVMFVDRNKRDGKSEGLRFDSSWDSDFFLCTTLVTRRKTSFFISLPSSRLTITLISIYKQNMFMFSFSVVLILFHGSPVRTLIACLCLVTGQVGPFFCKIIISLE